MSLFLVIRFTHLYLLNLAWEKVRAGNEIWPPVSPYYLIRQ